MRPFVSVIVPVYNVELYLDRCLHSLLTQSLTNIEIILVDDGSPDKCPQICDIYAGKDQRIKVIHKLNAGLGEARNSGLEIATGEYIAFVDSDDYVESNMYETLYHVAINRQCDIVYSGFKKEISKGKFLQVRETENIIQYEKDDIKNIIPDFIASPPYARQEYKYEMSVWHSIYKFDVIKKNKIKFISEREYVSEDIVFQVDMLLHVNSIVFIPDLLYVYCFNTMSLTKSLDLGKYLRFKKLYQILLLKTENYCDCSLRIERLFIGFVRALLRKVVKSNLKYTDKIGYLKSVVNDGIWKEIRQEFKPRFLPFKNAIVLSLIYNRNVLVLYVYLKLISLITK